MKKLNRSRAREIERREFVHKQVLDVVKLLSMLVRYDSRFARHYLRSRPALK